MKPNKRLEIENKDNLIEALMYEIEDRIWSDQLKDKEYSEISKLI